MIARDRFEELVRPHVEAAFNLAYWILRNREDAQDAVQDAYLQAFRAFSGFHGDQMRPWLLTIVRHAAFRISRSRQRGDIRPIDESVGGNIVDDALDLVSNEASPEALLIAADERAHVRATLGRLPAIHREVLVLRDMEELSYSEIAQVIGVPIGTVMSRLSRARSELRRLLVESDAEKKPSAL